MDATSVWQNAALRDLWAQAITPKFVGYFESFVGVPDPEEFKTKRRHHEDTKIPLKIVDRPNGSFVEFLSDVGLILLEQRGGMFKVTPLIPVTSPPPRGPRLPAYASFGRGRARVDRRRIYELDGGMCSYCGRPAGYENFVADHVYPLNKGGADEEANLTVQCAGCKKKWHHLPGDEGWVDPVRFRGRRVKVVRFAERGGLVYPDFELENV